MLFHRLQISSAPAISEAVSYRLSPELNVGAEVILQTHAVDAAGNEGISTARIIISQAAADPGYVQGKVLDDIRGLRMEGATVIVTDSIGETKTATTGTDGGYFMETAAGDALVKITRPGYTAIERRISVRPQQKTTARDARLAPVSSQMNLLDITGGTIRIDVGAGSKPALVAELNLPAAALTAQADLRLTPISSQGLAGILPPGWSPLAAIDIRALDPATGATLETTLATEATLKLPLPAVTIDPAAPPMLARYDETAHQWLAAGSAVGDTVGDSTIHYSLFTIHSVGQYAIVVPDPASNAPTAAQTGAVLAAAATIVLDYATVTATGKVVPQAALPSTGLKAAGEVVLTAKEGVAPASLLTSGLVLNSRITEKFELKAGDKIDSPVYTQDIILYRYPCITSIGAGAVTPLVSSGAELRTTFPVSPSKDYTIVDLLLGKVGVEITPPATADNGVMVSADGGRILDADGNVLLIPQGALSQTTPVSTRSVTATAAIGADFTLIKAVEVNLTRQTLEKSATLSIPTPDGFNPSQQIIVAKQIDVKGVARLKLVALAKQSGSFITSDISATGIVLSGITTTGTYYFLQARVQLGFVTELPPIRQTTHTSAHL